MIRIQTLFSAHHVFKTPSGVFYSNIRSQARLSSQKRKDNSEGRIHTDIEPRHAEKQSQWELGPNEWTKNFGQMDLRISVEYWFMCLLFLLFEKKCSLGFPHIFVIILCYVHRWKETCNFISLIHSLCIKRNLTQGILSASEPNLDEEILNIKSVLKWDMTLRDLGKSWVYFACGRNKNNFCRKRNYDILKMAKILCQSLQTAVMYVSPPLNLGLYMKTLNHPINHVILISILDLKRTGNSYLSLWKSSTSI